MTLKYSRQRESIKENLLHRTDHPTADMIYEDIRRVFPNVSLGTVYRNLALLSDLGEINRLPSLVGADRFDGRISPHHHFTCRVCGQILDMEDRITDELMREAGKQFAGVVEGCSVMFYGTCPECTQRS